MCLEKTCATWREEEMGWGKVSASYPAEYMCWELIWARLRDDEM